MRDGCERHAHATGRPTPWTQREEAELLWRVEESERRPTEIEAADDVDFDTFLLIPPCGCERIRYLLPRAVS